MNDSQFHFIIWVSMFISAIAICSFVYGYTNNINLLMGVDDRGEIIKFDATTTQDTQNNSFVGIGEKFMSGDIIGSLWDSICMIGGTMIEFWTQTIAPAIKGIPILGHIYYALEWIVTGFMFFIAIITLDIFPNDMPILIQILILTPVYIGLLAVIINIASNYLQSYPTT